jgi:hypothetical protein
LTPPAAFGIVVAADKCQGPSSMDIHSQPIASRIDWLFDIAARHAESFTSPESWLARQRYLAEHPTAILVPNCMDGRINIPIATRTPQGGIIQPFRNLGRPHLGEVNTDISVLSGLLSASAHHREDALQ